MRLRLIRSRGEIESKISEFADPECACARMADWRARSRLG
jgi:hypothetical protein